MFSFFLMDCLIHRIMESRVLSAVAIVIVALTPFQHEQIIFRQLETETTRRSFGDKLQIIDASGCPS